MKMQYECDQFDNLTPNQQGLFSLCFSKDRKWTSLEVHAAFRPLPIAAISITSGYVFVRFATPQLAIEAKARFGRKLNLMIPKDRYSGKEENSHTHEKRQRNRNPEMDKQANKNNNQTDKRGLQPLFATGLGGRGRGLLPVDVGIQQRELQDMTERLKGIMAMQAMPLRSQSYGGMSHDRGPVANETSLFRKELNELEQRLQSMMSLQSPHMQSHSAGAMSQDRNPISNETSLFRQDLNELEQRLQAMMSLQQSPQMQTPALTLGDLAKQFNDYRIEMNIKMSMFQQELFTLNHRLQDMAQNNARVERELQGVIKFQSQKENRNNLRIDGIVKSLRSIRENQQQSSSNTTETALTSKDLALLQAAISMQHNQDTTESNHPHSSGAKSPSPINVSDSSPHTLDNESPTQESISNSAEPLDMKESPSEIDLKEDSAESLSDSHDDDTPEIPSTEL